MKKGFKFLLVFLLVFALVGCKDKQQDDDGSEGNQPAVTKHTVQFYVEDELYKTLKVANDEVIGADKVDNPTLEGFEFVSWVDKDKKEVDLDTYQVTKALKLYATFKEIVTDDTLIVDGVKEEGKDYYLVVGWWETTAFEDDGVTPKVTSSLTPATVRVFYANLILYLQAYGATADQIDNIQFRNYSSETVAVMGENINADGDVDLVIGVGNNINSSAGVSLFEGNDGKTTAPMGTKAASRYVAIPEHEVVSEVAISVFDWIKTAVGQTAFTTQLAASDIQVVPGRTDEVNVNVKVHGLGEEVVETQLTNKNDPISVPELVLEAGYKFLGYATTADATVAEITAAAGVALAFANIETLLNGAESIELYPVIIEEVIDTNYDLVVYIHVTSTSKISEAEASLLAIRFEETLTEAKNINYVWVTEGKAADFKAVVDAEVSAGGVVDVVIGGNATTKELVAYDETHINASCGAGHFADGSRKILVLNSAASTHVELACAFYDFMVAEAPAYNLHVAYWRPDTWVTTAEIETISADIDDYFNTLFACEDVTTTYKLDVVYYNTTSEKVADLSAETKALNDGKGVGLIVGAGGNATNEGNMGSAIVEQKTCPTSIVAASRYVSLCVDNYLYRSLYDNYFIEVVAE